MSRIIGGGADRLTLKPLNPDGNRDGNDDPELDNILGCHTGSTFGLCVANPQPGFIYKWARKRGGDINYYRRRGGQVVQTGDPEHSVGSTYIEDQDSSPVDSADIYEDVILMRFPEEAIRQQTEEDRAKSDAQMRAGADEFVNQAHERPGEIQLSGGKPTRFARSDHRLDYSTGYGIESPKVDTWTPDQGIVDKAR
jgi:hypothetical protein